MHRKLTKYRRCCKQNNQLPTKSRTDLKDNSIMATSPCSCLKAGVNQLLSTTKLIKADKNLLQQSQLFFKELQT